MTSRAFLTFAALTLLFLSGCASASHRRDEAGYHLELGTTYLSQAQYPDALRELLKAEELNPDDPMTQNNLGLVFFFRGHFPEAESHLAKAVQLKPDFSEARNNYGRILIENRKFEKALQQLKMVLADLTYPDPSRTYVNLGLAYYRKGDFKVAKLNFAAALHIDRSHCLGQDMYGRSLLELGQYQDAAQALDNAVLICKDAKFDEPSYFSGLTYYKLGKTSFAIARMEEVMKLNPDGQYAKKAESMLKLMK